MGNRVIFGIQLLELARGRPRGRRVHSNPSDFLFPFAVAQGPRPPACVRGNPDSSKLSGRRAVLFASLILANICS